jgi:hypothetical protein
VIYTALTIGSHCAKWDKILNGVIMGISYSKWGKPDKFLLNVVIIATNDKLGGKK